jgi:glycosyltransferase involved in cell wall biosynthesis
VVIGFAGMVERLKGFDIFGKVCRKLGKKFDNLKYFVVGGSEKQKRSLYRNVILRKEKIPRSRTRVRKSMYFLMHRYYPVMDILLSPSWFESFGMANLEAMACERPVIAHDIAAIPEVLGKNGEAGYLVTPGDVETFVERASELIVDGKKREKIGKRARRRVLEKFTMKKMVKGYRNLFKEVIDNPKNEPEQLNIDYFLKLPKSKKSSIFYPEEISKWWRLF